MGLFNRKARVKPDAPKLPVVFVTHEDAVMFVVSRFFFADQLINYPNNEIVDGVTITKLPDFFPDEDSYEALVHRLRTIIDEPDQRNNRVRCYPYYIALTWDPLKHSEEYIDEIQKRIEDGVVETLAEYFSWEKPYDVGSFNSDQERLDLAKKLGVSWTLGKLR